MPADIKEWYSGTTPFPTFSEKFLAGAAITAVEIKWTSCKKGVSECT
jgi:hypothetical protein